MADVQKKRLGGFLLDWSAVIAIFLCILFFSAYKGTSFLSFANLTNILLSMSITTILAIALTVTLACDGFDMSACTLASCSGYVFMACYLWYGMNLFLSAVICVLFTMAAYLFTLFLILVCKIPDMLATCALMFVHQGLGAVVYRRRGNLGGDAAAQRCIAQEDLFWGGFCKYWQSALDYSDYVCLCTGSAYFPAAHKAGRISLCYRFKQDGSGIIRYFGETVPLSGRDDYSGFHRHRCNGCMFAQHCSAALRL